jgi:hypothetical protein
LDTGELVRFVTAGGTGRPDEPSPGLSVVAYRFDEVEGTLFRLQARTVDPPEVFDDEDNWRVCARRVKAVALEYFDGEEWREEWNSYEEDTLPRAVSIEITVETEGGTPLTFKSAAWTSCRRDEVRRTEVQERRGPPVLRRILRGGGTR